MAGTKKAGGLSWAAKLAMGYAAFGFLWILASDRLLLFLFEDSRSITYFQHLKGLVFVAASALLILLAVRFQLKALARKEAAVRASEKFMNDVFDSFQDGVSVLDRDLNIVRVNPVMERWFAHKKPLAGKKCYEVYLEPPAGKYPSVQTLSTGRGTNAELRVTVADGSARWMSLYSYPLVCSETGQTLGVLEYIRDVTALKEAEEALRLSERKYRTVFDAAGDAIMIIGIDGLIIEANRAASALLGIDGAGIAGMSFAKVYPEGEEFRATELLKGALVAGGVPTLNQYLVREDGSLVPVEVSAVAAEIAGRRVVLALLRDMTERKETEERTARQFEMLSALYSGAQNLAGSLDLGELARYAVYSCVENFGADFAWVGRVGLDEAMQRIASHPSETYPELAADRCDGPEDRGCLESRAIQSGLPVVVHDLAAETQSSPAIEAAVRGGLSSGAAFPLVSREKTFGVLTVYSGKPDFFTKDKVSFLQAYAHLAAATFENARLHEETRKRLERLDSLCTSAIGLASNLDLRVTLGIVIDQLVSQLGVDAADVLLADPEAVALEYAAGKGFRSPAIKATRQRIGEGIAGRAAAQRRTVHTKDLPSSEDDRAGLFREEGFSDCVATPLVTKGAVKGVVELFTRAPLRPDAEWMGFLEAMANQAAIAIENAGLVEDLRNKATELALAYETTLEGWSKALDLRDKETEGHTLRVTEMTINLARAMGMSEQSLVHVRRGALLHDIGKMAIPDNVLLKPGPLTDVESEIMRRHPAYAYEMLAPIEFLRPALAIPHLHHERWDGTGYPLGLKGEQIPLEARIFAVVDVWDALTVSRPYRQAMSKKDAVAYMRAEGGRQFDPKVVERFLEMIAASTAK